MGNKLDFVVFVRKAKRNRERDERGIELERRGNEHVTRGKKCIVLVFVYYRWRIQIGANWMRIRSTTMIPLPPPPKQLTRFASA